MNRPALHDLPRPVIPTLLALLGLLLAWSPEITPSSPDARGPVVLVYTMEPPGHRPGLNSDHPINRRGLLTRGADDPWILPFAEDDSDGDGFIDLLDLYPSDPLRWIDPPVPDPPPQP